MYFDGQGTHKLACGKILGGRGGGVGGGSWSNGGTSQHVTAPYIIMIIAIACVPGRTNVRVDPASRDGSFALK